MPRTGLSQVILDSLSEGVFTVEIIDGLITNFYAMRNPDKLAALTAAREITRS